MNNSEPISGWKLCPTSSVGSLKLPYVCYVTETCCKTGCCSSDAYPHFKTWYFWVMITIIFVILYSCAWYCQRLDALRKKRQREELLISRRRFISRSPSVSPRAISDTICLIDVEHGVDKDEKYDHQKALPKYEEALSMPKNTRDVADVHVYGDSDPEGLPTYEDVNKNEKKF